MSNKFIFEFPKPIVDDSMRPRITEEMVARFIEDYRQGVLQREIAKKYGVTQSAVSRYVKDKVQKKELVFKALNLPPEVRGYLAGIIDGEGCLSFHKEKTGTETPFLSIVNTNENLIVWLKSLFPWGYKGYCDNRREKPRWNLELRGMKRLIPLLLAVKDYLIVKRKQAELILEFSSSRLSKPGKVRPLTERELEIISEIHKLNTRGRW